VQLCIAGGDGPQYESDSVYTLQPYILLLASITEPLDLTLWSIWWRRFVRMRTVYHE